MRVGLNFWWFVVLGFVPLFASRAENWPHWRGANRDDVAPGESGWEAGIWPLGKEVWEKDVGFGASAPLVVGDKLYVAGSNGKNDTVFCLNAATGEELWSRRYAAPEYGRRATGDQAMYRGITATPEYDADSGYLFTLSCDGALNAWDAAADGIRVWGLNLYDEYDVPRRPQITKRRNTLRDYGYTTAPLVFGEWVIVEVGAPKRGNLAAFEKRTGNVAWWSENRDPAGHTGGLTLIDVEGVPCAAVATSYSVQVTRLDGKRAGETVAEFPWKTDYSNTIAGVAAEGSHLLVTSRYNQMATVKIAVTLSGGAREVWRREHVASGVCTPVIHKENIYWANKGIHCLDYGTGELRWVGGNVGDAGSCLVTGDDRLIVWGDGGDLALVETAEHSPEKCRILAENKGVFRDMAWPHVVQANGRLYCKVLSGKMKCFSLRK